MIIDMSIHIPKPDRERDLIATMHRFGAADAAGPGLVEGLVPRDPHSVRIVGMACWED